MDVLPNFQLFPSFQRNLCIFLPGTKPGRIGSEPRCSVLPCCVVSRRGEERVWSVVDGLSVDGHPRRKRRERCDGDRSIGSPPTVAYSLRPVDGQEILLLDRILVKLL